LGGLPERWFNYKAERKPAFYEKKLRDTYDYGVMEENGNRFLRFDGVDGKHLNFPTREVAEIDLYETPYLTWKWRVFDIPEGAREDKSNRNDVAASIYVVFDMGHVLFKKVPKSIVYTWSASLPVGTELSEFFNNKKTVVVQTGTENLGEWKEFSRNIVEDYRRLFGDDPPAKPLAILIFSDGDDTQKRVKADYDDIMLKKRSN